MIALFKELLANIKDKQLKATLTTLLTVAVFSALSIGAYLAVDQRYAHASEVTDLQKQLTQHSVELRNTVVFMSDATQRGILQEKILDIEDKPEKQRTDLDRSRLNRLKAQLENLDRKWDRSLVSPQPLPIK